MPRAADVLVDSLKIQGVDRVFCVPGESYLGVIDALYDAPDIDVVTVRQEGGGGFMAVADAKYTGRPAVEFVSRGPGATNAAIGVHVAQQDAVPLVLFIGQVARVDLGREAFQEVDYTKTFGGMAKLVLEVLDPDDLADAVCRAFDVARAPTPGPVVVSLPEDMLLDETSVLAKPVIEVPLQEPEPAAIREICLRLAKAERPILIAGGQVGFEAGRAALMDVAENWNVPVAVAWRRQDIFDHTHPNFACHLAFNVPSVFRDTLNEADLVLAIGTRLGDVTTQGYQIPTAPRPAQPLIHVYPDAYHLGRVFETALAVKADATATLRAIAASLAEDVPSGRADWVKKVHALSADRMTWTWMNSGDGVVFGNVVSHLIEVMDEDAVTAMDAGNFATWVQRLFPYKTTNVQMATNAGAMGMGVPSAIASALRDPERQVVCFAGDGGFLMTGNEMIAAVERNLPIRFIVSNNASFGTIRLYQERNHPDRTLATNLLNPDFAKLAEAYGMQGFKIETDDDIKSVIAEAFVVDGPSLIEVKTSLEYISAFTTISQMRSGETAAG